MPEMTMSDVAKLAAEIATQAAMEYLETERKRQTKRKKDWRLRNTKLLLRHYRSFVEHSSEVQVSPLESAEVLEELYSEEFVVESIRRSKQRTRAMVQFIQQMLQTYRIMCERSGKEEEMRRFQVLHAMYISDEVTTIEMIAECHFVDARTIYRDINDGAKTLSVLIFGVDGLRWE